MTRACILLTAVAVLLCVGANASAQVVLQAPQPAAGASSGDTYIDQALNQSQMQLTGDEKTKLKAMFAAVAGEFKDQLDPIQTKIRALDAKTYDMHKKGQDADPEFKAAFDERSKLYPDLYKLTGKRHERLMAELPKILTNSQLRMVETRVGLHGTNPAGFHRALAIQAIDAYAPKVDLTNAQYDQLMAKLVPMIDKYYADLAAANGATAEEKQAWMTTLNKNMQDVVAGVLTNEQKKQAAANRAERNQNVVKQLTDGVVKSIDRADPTDDQKRKAAALAATAREAMLKLNPGSPDYYKLYTQLRQDVEQLLTQDQRDKLQAPAPLTPADTAPAVNAQAPAPAAGPATTPPPTPAPKATPMPTPTPGGSSGDRI